VCLLIEHQSDVDRLMPLRTLYFAVLYWDKQWREWEQLPRPRPSFQLRPVLPLVIYTGKTRWEHSRRLVDLLGEPAAFHAFAPAWQPLLWNLVEQSPDALLASTSEWLKALAVLREDQADEAAFRAVFTQAVRGLAPLAGKDEVRWHDLMRMLLTWVVWRRDEIERPALLAEAQASQVDIIRQREIEAMTNKIGGTTAELAMARGEEKGKREGQLLTARAMLHALLEDRFGPLPEALSGRIDATEDPALLQAAFRQALHIEKIEELQL
jgi:Putative transposase, YhgA-like